MAIGNPFQLGHTVTVGFVSFQGRPFQMLDGRWQDMIQTDASINPGNSGGPLIDVHGEVVGINVAIATGGNIGIGFAVQINSVKALRPQLLYGRVVRGQLGVRFHDGRAPNGREWSRSKSCPSRRRKSHPPRAEDRRYQRLDGPHAPIFLLVWRRDTEVFLQMRKD